MKHEHQFLVMWDNTGLEYVADLTADNQRVTWEALQGKASPKHSYANPMHLKLRARYNPQRHYEIYIFNAAEGITKEDIEDMFEASPQTAADTIRKIGHCYHSDRVDTKNVVII